MGERKRHMPHYSLLELSLRFTGPHVCLYLANSTKQNPTKVAIIPHPVMKYSEFYGTRMFITVFTKARQLFLPTQIS
jgi:hypothetical protein